jgi:hypothetical protein
MGSEHDDATIVELHCAHLLLVGGGAEENVGGQIAV